MSKRLDPSELGGWMYNSLPSLYRNIDADYNFALQRYISALADSGLAEAVEETNGILDIIDPSRVREDILPVLAAQYGFDMFNGIPTNYARKLLEILGDLYAKKGTVEVLTYLASIISGANVYVRESSGLNEMRLNRTRLNDTFYLLGNEWDKRFSQELIVELDWDSPESSRDVPDIDVMKRIIKDFAPFYMDTEIVYSYIYVEESFIEGKDSTAEEYIFENTVESPSVAAEDHAESVLLLGAEDDLLSVRPSQLLNSSLLSGTFRLGYVRSFLYYSEDYSDFMESMYEESRRLMIGDMTKESIAFKISRESANIIAREGLEDHITPLEETESWLLYINTGAGDHIGFILGKQYSTLNTLALAAPDSYDIITHSDGSVEYGYPVLGDYLIYSQTA